MKAKGIAKKAVALAFVVVLTTFVLAFHEPKQEIYAYETSCPEYMTDAECLEFLQEQANKIREDKSKIESDINAENYEQMTLGQQISYLASQVAETELKIAEKEVDIEKNNLEIKLLGEDIVELQNTIDTLTQEINTLESSIEKRTKSSYKMTFISPVEILLDSQNLESMMRKMKYLLETKKKDRELLTEMVDSKGQLKTEEETLAKKREEVQQKRNEIESQRAELAEDRKNLESQQAQQQVLLAESQRREQEYLASLDQIKGVEEQANQKIAQLIMRMYESGQLGDGTPVTTGDYVGFQGHTGCSFGSHLHFSVNNGVSIPGWGYFWGNVNPYGYMTGSIPMSGWTVTQGYHQGQAIDLVSTTAGDQTGDYYYAKKGSIPCAPSYEGWLPLRGEGAPVRTIMNGKVYYGTESWYGGKFAMVVHDNSYVSIYLHIR